MPREHTYSKMPLQLGENRDENILIEVLGNWIPECDLIYYGLLNSSYSEKFYKLKNSCRYNPRDIYLDTCYFSGDDLIRYLASETDELHMLPEEILTDATKTALNSYTYVPCNESMLRHSIIELAYYDFVKSITLLYPWEIRKIDYDFIRSIVPFSILPKFKIVSGDLLGFIESKSNTDIRYTTIIMNSLSDVNTLIDECDKYHTEASFFLLRNHSGNVSCEIVDDPNSKNNKKIIFDEIGTKEIFMKLMDIDRMIPKTQMRFARYEPHLFNKLKLETDNKSSIQ